MHRLREPSLPAGVKAWRIACSECNRYLWRFLSTKDRAKAIKKQHIRDHQIHARRLREDPFYGV